MLPRSSHESLSPHSRLPPRGEVIRSSGDDEENQRRHLSSMPLLKRAFRVFVNASFLLVVIFFFFYFFPSPPSFIFHLKTSDTSNARGYINYLNLFYGEFGDSPVLGYILLALWLVVLFYLLGNTASEYFCTSLESLSRVLNLSPAIAGATLLSLGNGAPDVFAGVVSLAGGGRSVGEVGLSSILGGALFVSCGVLGVVSICVGRTSSPVAPIDRLSFVRDLCFIFIVMCFLVIILSFGQIGILGAVAFFCLYIVYVILVSMTHYCRKELGGQATPLLESIEVVEQQKQPSQEAPSKLTFFDNPKSSVFNCLSWFLFLIELPLYLPRRLTILVVAEDRWSKPFAVASATLSPILLAALWSSKTGETGTTIIFPIAALSGILLGIATMEFTEDSHPPKKIQLPWLAGGFVMSVVWTYIIAGELISLLVSIGQILGVSPTVMGVTVLAWGNSVGDLMANVTMAVKGGEDGAQIAVAGCYAGPIFNTLVGLGLSFVLCSWNAHPSPFVIPNDSSEFVIIGFLVGGLLWALVMLQREGMRLSRGLGVGLLAIYCCFLCLRLLQSLQIF